MDQFGHTLDALKTTAGKAICLCETLQTQNKAQADRIAELELALDYLFCRATRLDQSVTKDGLDNCDALAMARTVLAKGKV